MPKRVLLFQPPLDLGYSVFTPLGLAMIHAATPTAYRAEVWDYTQKRWTDLTLNDFDPFDLIGVSVRYSYNQRKIKNFLRLLHNYYPDKIIIVGGQHATHDVEGMLGAGASYVVRYLGEKTWPELLETLHKGETPNGMPGLAYRDSETGSIVIGENRPFLPPEQLPFPSFEVFRAIDYPFPLGQYAASIEASRDCPNHCRFCTNPEIWMGKWAPKPITRVVQEMDILSQLGFNFAFFTDDNFGANYNKLQELLEALAQRDPVIPFMAEIQPQTIARHPKILSLAWDAGLRIISLDTNTIDPETLALYDRPDDVNTIREALDAIKRSPIAAVSNVMLGAPGQSLDSMKNDIRFTQKHADIFSCGTLEPRPGNQFWKPEHFEITDRMCKGEPLLHDQPQQVRRLIHRALLGYYFHPKQLLRIFFSPKIGVRILMRLHFRMYSNAALNKFLRRDRTVEFLSS